MSQAPSAMRATSDRARADTRTAIGRIAVGLRAAAPWCAYVAVAVACTKYLNHRSDLVPKRGEWYAADGHSYVLMQVRAFFSGRLALLPHPWSAGHDYDWGRGGMHSAWGLGVPILAIPFHAVGRLFGAPGFPDDLRFLILYAAATVVLARALHRTAPKEPTALVASAGAAGFVMVFPTFVGMVSSRFQIYEQTIATGALWSVLLLSGVLALLHRCTTRRLVAVCAAAGFAIMIRPPLVFYGLTTAALALLIARRGGVRLKGQLAGLAAFAAVSALYLIGNALRFGSPFNPGYANCVSGPYVGRLARWGLPFAKVPLTVAAKEMFATLFLLEPVPNQIMMGTPPASVQPYVVGDRWREYYAPTFDKLVFAVWVVALGIVCWQVFRHRLWRRDRTLAGEVMTVVGAWAIPPSIALFLFYARIGNMVTRYATDLYPAFAASFLCLGMAVAGFARRWGPGEAAAMQLAMACGMALYIDTWQGWATHLSRPLDRKTLASLMADIDLHSNDPRPDVPDHFRCNQPRGPSPVHTHLEDWGPDCHFASGLVFAMPHSRCVSFTFLPGSGTWESAPEIESLARFRATADFDTMVRCGGSTVDGNARRVTMCDPHPPAFLLDGMRLYSIASLDENLNPIDRLKLMRIDAAPACP